MKTCCVTGHRPKGFSWNYYDVDYLEHQRYLMEMATKIKELIDDGYTHFISGGAIGVDMDFAETIIYIKEMYEPEITLEIAVPCPKQDLKWGETDKQRYQKIIKNADKISQLSNNYTPSCMQKRNEYMVDNSDLVLAFWNGTQKGGTFNTITYARKQNKVIVICKI